MAIEFRQTNSEAALGYNSVYVSAENPLPVALVGGGAGGPVTSDDVTVDEEGGTLTAYIADNDAAVDAASKTATWGQVANRPSTFTPSTHTHEIEDINGLQAKIEELEGRLAALETEPEE